jgi:hypothetical protein
MHGVSPSPVDALDEEPCMPGGNRVYAPRVLEGMLRLPPGKKNGGKPMNKKIGMRAFPLLLAVMLVSTGVMPIASAIEGEGAGIDLDQHSPPQLNVNPSIETIAISEALSPQ